jgi:hypothetical protein
MALQSSDIQYLLAAPNATSGYSLPGTVYNSNGLYCSTTQVDFSVPRNNVFPDEMGPQTAAQQVDYQCVFVYNSNTSSTFTGVTMWIPTTSVVSSAINWALGADPTGATPYQSTGSQAVEISSPYIVPSGVNSWAAPSSSIAGGVFVGDIGPRQVCPVWIRRTATGTPANLASMILYASGGQSG